MVVIRQPSPGIRIKIIFIGLWHLIHPRSSSTILKPGEKVGRMVGTRITGNWVFPPPDQVRRSAGIMFMRLGWGLISQLSTDSYLRSPIIDLSDKKIQATLSFSEFRKIDPGISFHRVSVVILDAETEEIIEEPYEASGATNDWEAQSLRLKPDSLARKIIVEFWLSTDDFNLQEGWFIDDVKIVAE